MLEVCFRSYHKGEIDVFQAFLEFQEITNRSLPRKGVIFSSFFQPLLGKKIEKAYDRGTNNPKTVDTI
jgi:hypothetical protein